MRPDAVRIEEIFSAAAGITDAAARTAYLDQACGGDVPLRERVEVLLAAHDSAASFLELPATTDWTKNAFPRLSEGPGTKIGRYKLLEEIGEGGFGVVFMAEQEEPVRRRVALKIIKAGMDTRQVVARFEAERQALAMMDHPNIARVFDAGATETGRPYFVMELVKGIPITEYCDQQKLSTDERLTLFMAVCSAVQHAHQKGIIHRDLKPSNVMVTLHDDKAVPKIIDFGIAKATQARLTDKTLFTEFRQLIGTPAYMSPEQAQMIGLDVDTRSDIYSLGVLLYELLTGTTPFDSKELVRSGYDEMRRIIREVEPPKPSTRLSTLVSSGTLGTRASERASDPSHLSHEVRGDLDWIVMKCLEKDRTRRYDSAGSLARDIERHLRDEPVYACPPSAGYLFRKFARRNKTLLVAGGAIAAALLVGLGLATWQHFRATAESARAQAVSELMRKMLSSADRDQTKGEKYTVRELLDDFSAGLGNQLADQPAAAADIHATIGGTYSILNLPAKAIPHLEKAIELRQQADGPEHENVAKARVQYSWNLQELQRYVEAETQVGKALEVYRRRGVTGWPVAHGLSALQKVLLSMGRYDEAKRVIDEARAVADRSGEGYYDVAIMLMRYANLKNGQREFAEAEQLARQSIEMQRAQSSNVTLTGAHGLLTLSKALQSQEKLEAAEQAARESLAIFRRRYAPDREAVRKARDQLKSVLASRGDKAGLDALAGEEAEQVTRSGGPEYHVRLAKLLLMNRPQDAQQEEARRLVRWAIDEYGQEAVDYPDDFDRRLIAVTGFLELVKICYASPGLANELVEVNRRMKVELPQLVLNAKRMTDPNVAANSLYYVGVVQARLGDTAGHRTTCQALVELPFGKLEGLTKSRPVWTPCLMLNAIDDPSLPVKLGEEFVADNSPGEPHFRLYVLGAAHYRAGQYAQAAQRLEESIAAFPSGSAPVTDSKSYHRLFLAMTQWKLGKKDEARQLLAETQPDVERELESPASAWNRRATLEILRAEAEALIGKNRADKAPNMDASPLTAPRVSEP
jgi:tetratricopeptide (TPR) repeat protein